MCFRVNNQSIIIADSRWLIGKFAPIGTFPHFHIELLFHGTTWPRSLSLISSLPESVLMVAIQYGSSRL